MRFVSLVFAALFFVGCATTEAPTQTQAGAPAVEKAPEFSPESDDYPVIMQALAKTNDRLDEYETHLRELRRKVKEVRAEAERAERAKK